MRRSSESTTNDPATGTVSTLHAVVYADLVDMSFDEMVESLAGVEVLFHLAAEKYNSSHSTPTAVIDTNITATHRLFLAAAAAGVAKIVFTSSLYAYGAIGPSVMRESDVLTPTTMYGMSRLRGRTCCGSLTATTVSCAGPSPPLLHLWTGPIRRRRIQVSHCLQLREDASWRGAGDQWGWHPRLDYVYIDDCLEALCALAVSPENGIIVNVASGQGHSINGLTALMQNVAGSDQDPATGSADWTAGTSRVGANQRIGQLIRWKPRTSMEQGLTDVWEWMGAEHA